MKNFHGTSKAKDPFVAKEANASISCQGNSLSLVISLANNFWKRFCGLMFRKSFPEGWGLLLTHCNSVHTMFMRFPIDVIYLDNNGKIVKCIEGLKPWRFSFGGPEAEHCLELTTGVIAKNSVTSGDHLYHYYFDSVKPHGSLLSPAKSAHSARQTGATMVEFLFVSPIITMIGLGILQYSLLFFAKNNINHAAFMAARAGSVGNADLKSVQTAYNKALIPLYGGGRDAIELAQTLVTVNKDLLTNSRIEMLSPTKESFDDWSDDALKATIGKGASRVIPNSGQAFRDVKKIGSKSGQNIQDANLIKLRITYGYEMKVPFVKEIMKVYLKWLDPKDDVFHTQLVKDGRFPVVTHVTLQMQSDAIEPTNPVSTPGMGDNGNPSDPGDPPTGGDGKAPKCPLSGCSSTTSPNDGNGDSGGSCKLPMETVSSDVLFDFNSAVLKPAAQGQLNKIIEESKTRDFSSMTIRGYTDQIGSDSVNAKLSLDRANAVRDYLLKNGFPTGKSIDTEGKGATDPVVPLSSCTNVSTQKSCLAANRRVTFSWNKA